MLLYFQEIHVPHMDLLICSIFPTLHDEYYVIKQYQIQKTVSKQVKIDKQITQQSVLLIEKPTKTNYQNLLKDLSRSINKPIHRNLNRKMENGSTAKNNGAKLISQNKKNERNMNKIKVVTDGIKMQRRWRKTPITGGSPTKIVAEMIPSP